METRFLIFLISISAFLSSCENKTAQLKQGIKKDNKLLPNQSKYPKIYKIIKDRDSLLFELGFNAIDTVALEKLLAEDFEFYHDVHGITDSKQAFLKSVSGLKELPFKTWRRLRLETMEVYPLYAENRSKLYAVIQTGKHDFYQQKKGEKAKKSGTARFNHLWILEGGEWKLKRVLSFDHHE